LGVANSAQNIKALLKKESNVLTKAGKVEGGMI
jgi:hypothetical protein